MGVSACLLRVRRTQLHHLLVVYNSKSLILKFHNFQYNMFFFWIRIFDHFGFFMREIIEIHHRAHLESPSNPSKFNPCDFQIKRSIIEYAYL